MTNRLITDVYIILVNYNGWKDTIECLESLYNSAYRGFHVVVVDNSSANGSIEKIAHWADGTLQEDIKINRDIFSDSLKPIDKPVCYKLYSYNNRTGKSVVLSKNKGHANCQLTIIQASDNQGFATGSNVGIRYAMNDSKCKYIWLLNNDTVVSPTALSALVMMAKNLKMKFLLGSKILYYYKPKYIQTIGGVDSLTWKQNGRFLNNNMIDTNYGYAVDVNGYIYGASLFATRKAFNEVGLFDERYFMFGEEADWCLRAKQHDYKQVACSPCRVWHKEGGTCGSASEKVALQKVSKRVSVSRFIVSGYYFIRNRIFFVKKHFNSKNLAFLIYFIPSLLRLLLGILLYDDFKWVRIKLVIAALRDGINNKVGKTIDPLLFKYD